MTPPYYAVIFTSTLIPGDTGYADFAHEVLALARQQPGFLGFDSARQEVGVSVSYWASLEAIEGWKNHPFHRQAQARAGDWYASFQVRVCKVERDFGFTQPAQD
ncbi:MAG: antibiotic biosynthesis monooxygenase [Alphaproteobacteria bacterium CG_4_10_14_0_2_um_filter_63_37]|nr:MAG: antibiotic biosynthesis monooxygenase [Proteobacteria bacterium CG1_02_64_396]PJA25626.1 MAG: antibiotic biosynthesis monooxygenase [Alphaproteobacteria bacterium CG_4_10_14_0_2_um_filter_63_37]